MGAFATSNPTGGSDITGSGTAGQVAVFQSAQAIGNPTIQFTSTSSGFTVGSAFEYTTAMLALDSVTQGFLPPRMTTVQREAISSPTVGLMVYDSDIASYSFRTTSGGSANWATVLTSSSYPTTFAIGDILYASSTSVMSRLADVAAGSYLRSGGVGAAPVWSTLILPNSATANQIVYASSTNTYGGSSTFLWDNTSLYVGTASLLGSGDVANFFRNQNGATYVRITNNTSGTIAQAGLVVSANNGSTSGLVLAMSAGLTSSGLAIADTFGLRTNLAGGTVLGNIGAAPIYFGTNNVENWRIASGGNLSNTGGAGTAYFHLKAGTATASTAPLKFTSGTSLTVAEAGAWEYDGTKFFATNSTAARGTVNETRINSSSAATLTLAYTYTAYVFTGTTTTWTLPAVASSTNSIFYIKNRGSGAITLNSDSGNTLYTSTAVNTLTINPGEAYMLLGDGTYFLVN